MKKHLRSMGFILALVITLVSCSQIPIFPPATVVPAASTPKPPPPPFETSQPASPPLELVWKLKGDPNPFNKPFGVTTDTQGNVYVWDWGNSRIQKFDRDGKFITMWGQPGTGPGQFSPEMIDPNAGRLAADGQGNIYVADVGNYRIQKFDQDGKFITQWGTKGTGEGQFSDIGDIAIDKQNNIYVGDDNNNTILKFDQNGRFLLGWGGTGTQNGQFTALVTVAVAPDGSVWASDGGNLQKFDANGKFLSIIPQPVVGNRLMSTWSIATDDQGNIYVADHRNYRIVKLDPLWKPLGSWNGPDAGTDAFVTMEDIAVDAQGNIYITDIGRNTVYKFRQVPAAIL